MKIAIVGAGRWSERYCKTLADFPDLKLVALLRRLQERPAFIPDGCQVYTNIDELFNYHGDLDGIIVATDNPGEMVKECFKYKVPVLAEKPLFTDRRTLRRWQNVDGSKLLVDYTHLFSPAFIKLQEIVKGKEILGIRSEGFNSGPVRERFSSLWDYGVHDMSLILSLLPEKPDAIKIREKKTSKDTSLYEILLTYPKFAAKSTVGNGSETKSRNIHVVFEDNGLKEVVYDDLADNKLTLEGKPVEIGAEKPLCNVIEAFKALIEGKKDERFGLELTRRITKTLSEFRKRKS